MEGKINMGWFTKKKEENNIIEPSEMSPLEAVTHLCAAIQLADGKVDYEERESWLLAIKNLFPEFVEERADRFLNDAQIALNQKQGDDKKNYIIGLLSRIKLLLNKEQMENFGPKIAELIESDGIVMTSEIEIARLIESELKISIILDNDT